MSISIRRHTLFALGGLLVFFAGALVGRAQHQIPRPDFQIVIEPAHNVSVTCVSGCQFISTRAVSGGELRRVFSLTDTLSNLTGSTYTIQGVIAPARSKSGN